MLHFITLTFMFTNIVNVIYFTSMIRILVVNFCLSCCKENTKHCFWSMALVIIKNQFLWVVIQLFIHRSAHFSRKSSNTFTPLILHEVAQGIQFSLDDLPLESGQKKYKYFSKKTDNRQNLAQNFWSFLSINGRWWTPYSKKNLTNTSHFLVNNVPNRTCFTCWFIGQSWSLFDKSH